MSTVEDAGKGDEHPIHYMSSLSTRQQGFCDIYVREILKHKPAFTEKWANILVIKKLTRGQNSYRVKVKRKVN